MEYLPSRFFCVNNTQTDYPIENNYSWRLTLKNFIHKPQNHFLLTRYHFRYDHPRNRMSLCCL
jgi:hypothetical protein